MKQLDEARILEIASHPDGFAVHKYRFKEGPTRTKCRDSKRKGLLSYAGQSRDTIIYKITDAGTERLKKLGV